MAVSIMAVSIEQRLTGLSVNIHRELDEYVSLSLDVNPNTKIQTIQRATTSDAKSKFHWAALNRRLSERFIQKVNLDEEFQRCSALVTPSATRAITHKFGEVKQIYKTLASQEAELLERFTKCSIALGKKDYPIQISTAKQKPKSFEIDPDSIVMKFDQGKFTVEIPARAQPSLVSRIARGIWNHKGKIAFGLSSLIIANQTDMGAQLLASVAGKTSQVATEILRPLKDTVLSTAKEYLPAIGSILSTVWALPSAYASWKAGKRKTAGAILLAGVASGAAPHLLQSRACGQAAQSLLWKVDQTAQCVSNNSYAPIIGAATSLAVAIPTLKTSKKAAAAMVLAGAGIGAALPCAPLIRS